MRDHLLPVVAIRACSVIVFIACMVAVSSPVLAETWQPVQGEAIEALLTGRDVSYEGETKRSQSFHDNGTTTYVDGRPSLGNWKASQTQYCSQWPPSSSWDCYDLFVDETGERIRFIGGAGDVWIATLTAEPNG